MSRPASIPERTALVVAWTAILVGAAVRAWAVSQRGSLWLDEAALALNVLTRSLGGLAHPLDWGQAAPVGFLWVERLMAAHADVPDRWLRLVPLCAGIALPWVLWQLGRRVVGTGAGALAAVTAAGSLLALRYSTEAKPYASDAVVAAALLWLSCEVIRLPEEMARWWALAVAAVIAAAISIPSVFVIAAVVAAIASDAAARRAPGARRVALPALATAAALFTTFWLLAYRHGASSPHLRDYWAPVMLDLTAGDRVVRVIRVLMELTWIPLRWTGSLLGTAAGTALWVGGVAFVARRNRSDAVLLAGPVAFAAAASVLGAYPLSDRLAFFAVPGVWVAQAAAIIAMRNAAFSGRSILANARTAAVFVVAVACGVAAWQYTDSQRFLHDPGALEPTRALFAKVDADAATVPIYVFARSAPAWLLATRDSTWRGNARLERWTLLAGRDGAPGYENAPRAGAVAAGDGNSLVVVSGTRTELVGLAPGVQYRIAGAPSRAAPSPGWAEEEARRLLAVARPEVWLVASHFFADTPRNELRPLVEAAVAAGLRVVEERHAGNDVVALRLSR
jgi:Dolichyl-phosphate-mannose-protein mannosyltransferase